VISVLASGSSTLPTNASQKNRAGSPILTYWFVGLNVARGRSGELTEIREKRKIRLLSFLSCTFKRIACEYRPDLGSFRIREILILI